MIGVTVSGTKGSIWVVAAVVAFLTGDARLRPYAVLSMLALLLAEGACNLVLKPLFARERPYVRNRLAALLVDAPGRHSWPSAHAASSMAAGTIWVVGAWPWGLALLGLALLIGYSRVYVGVHYPADVLAGFAIGELAAGAVLLAASLVHVPGA